MIRRNQKDIALSTSLDLLLVCTLSVDGGERTGVALILARDGSSLPVILNVSFAEIIAFLVGVEIARML